MGCNYSGCLGCISFCALIEPGRPKSSRSPQFLIRTQKCHVHRNIPGVLTGQAGNATPLRNQRLFQLCLVGLKLPLFSSGKSSHIFPLWGISWLPDRSKHHFVSQFKCPELNMITHDSLPSSYSLNAYSLST